MSTGGTIVNKSGGASGATEPQGVSTKPGTGKPSTPAPPRRRRKGGGILVAIALLLIALVAGGVFVSRSRAKQAASQQVQYRITKVTTGRVRKSISSTGTLKPWSVVDIKSRAGGQVLAMNVEVGDEVTKNQIIARIDPNDSQTAFNQAKANLDSAKARQLQSTATYELQLKQTEVAIRNAEASLASSKASLAQAGARLATATTQANNQPSLTNANIASAQASYNQAVKQRQQLDVTNRQQKVSIKASYDQAVANRNNSKANLDRQESLLKKGFVSQQAVDQARATLAVDDAQVSTAKINLDTLDAQQATSIATEDARVAQSNAALETAKSNAVAVPNQKNSLKESQAAYLQAQAQVKSAQASLAQAKANAANNEIRRYDISTAQATIASSEASLDNTQKVLEQTEVRAPSEGVVLQKYVEQGAIITSGMSLNSEGTSLIQIGDTSRMYVDVTVDETDIAGVDVGQEVSVTIEAYPGVPFDGKVARINPQAQVENNVTSVHVRVEIDNSSPAFRLLKPEMNATCEFIMDEKNNVISVPTEAIHSDDNGSYVEVAEGGKPAPGDPAAGVAPDPNTLIEIKKKRVGIETDLEGDNETEVTSGLKEGDQVIVQTIEPVTTTAAPAGAAGGSPFGGGAGGGRGFGGGGGGGGRR